MQEVANVVWSTGLLAGATLCAYKWVSDTRRHINRYEEVGLCSRCKGTGEQDCQACYGRGSIAKPGYVNVADPFNRTNCRRCGGSGQHSCGACGASGAAGVSAPSPVAMLPQRRAVPGPRAALPPGQGQPLPSFVAERRVSQPVGRLWSRQQAQPQPEVLQEQEPYAQAVLGRRSEQSPPEAGAGWQQQYDEPQQQVVDKQADLKEVSQLLAADEQRRRQQAPVRQDWLNTKDIDF